MSTTCHGKQNPDCTARYHGTPPAYTRHGCRCPHAREANRINRKRLREGRHQTPFVNAIGTARRLQALAAIGWPLNELANRLGMLHGNVKQIAHANRPARHHTTANRVAALYRELAGIPGPSPIARSRAAAKGWHSPMAWDNIDNPDEQPDMPLSTCGETLAERAVRHAQRLEEFRNLRAAGTPRRRIQDQLHINSRLYVKLLAQIQDTTNEGQAAA